LQQQCPEAGRWRRLIPNRSPYEGGGLAGGGWTGRMGAEPAGATPVAPGSRGTLGTGAARARVLWVSPVVVFINMRDLTFIVN